MSEVIALDLSHPSDRDRRTSATPPSHPSDTGSSSYKSSISIHKSNPLDPLGEITGEIEITPQALNSKTKPRARFLKGPIPLESLAIASCLPGKALAVYIALRHRCDLEGKSTVSLPAALLLSFGVDRDSKARALRVLENAGLIQVERTPGRAAQISLKSLPPTA